MTRCPLQIDRPNPLLTGSGWPLVLEQNRGRATVPEKAELLPEKRVQKNVSLHIKFGRENARRTQNPLMIVIQQI
jgi:ABC-type nitrate/sulfonate/bicarbonate transport system ATPase subunit